MTPTITATAIAQMLTRAAPTYLPLGFVVRDLAVTLLVLLIGSSSSPVSVHGR